MDPLTLLNSASKIPGLTNTSPSSAFASGTLNSGPFTLYGGGSAEAAGARVGVNTWQLLVIAGAALALVYLYARR